MPYISNAIYDNYQNCQHNPYYQLTPNQALAEKNVQLSNMLFDLRKEYVQNILFVESYMVIYVANALWHKSQVCSFTPDEKVETHIQ